MGNSAIVCAGNPFADPPIEDGECLVKRYAGDGTTCGDFVPVCKELIPTVSEWGLIVTALLGLTAGTILFRRRQVATA